jgi:hypothetical protein
MSRTFGHTKDQTAYKMGPHKMKPYTSEHNPYELKEVVRPRRGTGITPLGKLVAKNANRAQKKSARQEGDKNILDELND